MHLIPTLALLVALSFSFSSSATDEPRRGNVIRVPLERKSFVTQRNSHSTTSHANIDLLRAQVARIATKYRATLASYQENTGSPHPLARAISAISSGAFVPDQKTLPAEKRRQIGSSSRYTKRTNGDISLTEVNSNMWMGTISVGTPPQDFTVDFDTGSADLILPAQGCDSTCDGHTLYNSAASSTSVDLNETFQMVYSGGSAVNGTEYTDSVYMGGYEAVNQTLGAATTYSGMESPEFVPDGLLGLGFSAISSLGAPPVFQTMVSTGVVSQAVFGFALSSVTGNSELTIGGTNVDMYQESTVEYVSVSLAAYWQIPLAGLSRPGSNGTSDVVLVDTTSYAQSIVDTGTTLIVTTDSNAQAFFANVTGAADIGGGLWSVPCDTVGSIAPTLTFGSRSFAVSSSTFNLGPVSDGSTDCIAGLAGGGSAYWIIGDVFLQNVYSIFDVANTRIGFADLS